jgi:hypothetical protein
VWKIINTGKNGGKKYMNDALNIKTLIVILIAGIVFTSVNLMPVVNAQLTHTSLTLAIPFAPTDKECTIEATLKDESGNPLQNMDINFYFCGSSLIGTNTTDSTGVASLKLSDDLPSVTYPRLKRFEPKKTETWPIFANFSGTTTYAPSGSEYLYIAFVLIDYTPYPYMVGSGALAVVIISVVGYIVFRRRERARTMSTTANDA